MKEKMFISIPISGRDPKTVLLQSSLAEELVHDLGFQPINPFSIVGLISTDPNDFDHWKKSMEVCFHELINCKQILIVDLPERKFSRGCQIEEFTSKTLGLDIYYTDKSGRYVKTIPAHNKQ